MIQNQIQIGRFNRALSRLFRIADTPAPSVAPEIMPVHIASPDGPENVVLREERRYIFGQGQVGTALLTGVISLTNPAGSGILAIIEEVMVASSAPESVFFGGNDTTPSGGAPFSGFPLDSRIGTGASVAFVSSLGLAGPSLLGGQAVIGSNVTLFLPVRAVLAPGTSFRVTGQIGVQTTIASFIWRERTAAPEELTLG